MKARCGGLAFCFTDFLAKAENASFPSQPENPREMKFFSGGQTHILNFFSRRAKRRSESHGCATDNCAIRRATALCRSYDGLINGIRGCPRQRAADAALPVVPISLWKQPLYFPLIEPETMFFSVCGAEDERSASKSQTFFTPAGNGGAGAAALCQAAGDSAENENLPNGRVCSSEAQLIKSPCSDASPACPRPDARFPAQR